MTRYRFLPEDFKKMGDALSYGEAILGEPWMKYAAEIANACVEQWEKESEKVYACEWAVHEKQWNAKTHSNDTHQATLWNPKKIEEKT